MNEQVSGGSSGSSSRAPHARAMPVQSMAEWCSGAVAQQQQQQQKQQRRAPHARAMPNGAVQWRKVGR